MAQTSVRAGDREGNCERLAEMLEKNWKPSDEVTAVVMPELWDVGYVIDDPGFYGDPENYMALEFLGDLAKKYGCWFVGGSVFALTDDGAFNRALAVSPDGKLAAHYDKAHLVPFMNETTYLRAGSARALFDLGGAKAGMAVCYDLRFCEWIRLYAADGAEVMFFSAEWPTERVEHWRIMLQSRAVENNIFVVGCNNCGKSGKTTFGGHSMVIDPWGKILFEAADEPEFSFVEIDTEEAKKAEKLLKTMEMRRPEIYK